MFIVIDGEPMSKGRPRVTTRGGYAHAYTPEATTEYEMRVREAYLMKYDARDDKNMYKAEIKAYYKIPKSASKSKAQDMRIGKIRPTKKPDTDNIAKIILDALNGIAYHDDSQIVSLNVEKYYSDEPRVAVAIDEVR